MQLQSLIAIVILSTSSACWAQAASQPGKLVLEGSKAELTGERLQYDLKSKSVRGLAKPSESLAWSFQIDKSGWYQVVVHYALTEDRNAGKSVFNATIGDQNRLGPIHSTGSMDQYLPQVLFDPMELKAGGHQLKLQLKDSPKSSDLHIRKVELVRAREPGVP